MFRQREKRKSADEKQSQFPSQERNEKALRAGKEEADLLALSPSNQTSTSVTMSDGDPPPPPLPPALPRPFSQQLLDVSMEDEDGGGGGGGGARARTAAAAAAAPGGAAADGEDGGAADSVVFWQRDLVGLQFAYRQ